MPKVPRKNISSKMADIVPRGFSSASRQAKVSEPIHADRVEQFAARPQGDGSHSRAARPAPRFFSLRRFVTVFLAATLLVGGSVSIYAYRALPPSRAAQSGSHLIDWERVKELIAQVKNIGERVSSFRDASSGAFALLAEAKTFTATAIADARSGHGDLVIARLENVRALLGRVAGAGDMLFDARVQIERTQTFLDHLIAWLKEDRDHHIAIFLENPSEIRPGGGFVGSYVDLVIRGGNIVTSTVHDVNDADRLLGEKVVPPAPLQLIAKRWRAADANWFFDFPESASTTLAFLENSDLYHASGVTFDMAIGVSGHAIEDMLTMSGPITLSDGTVLRSDNVLAILQARVQAGQSAGSKDAKAVLKEFAPLLLEKVLSQAPSGGDGSTATNVSATTTSSSLASYIEQWVVVRDVRIFAKDRVFQNFFDTIHATGGTYEIPAGFNGDYLAIARANIGSGKSDTFIKEKVLVESQISEDGTVNTHLTLSRFHSATDADPWWYNAPNQTYLQVMTAPSAALTYASGGSDKTIAPRAEYRTGGYTIDPRIAILESSIEHQPDYPTIGVSKMDGKRTFATWIKTQPGATSTLELAYTTHLTSAVKSGMEYTFIFEKQSGTSANYDFQISAPVGFVFAENELPVYEYSAANPPGRLTLVLTLKPITDL